MNTNKIFLAISLILVVLFAGCLQNNQEQSILKNSNVNITIYHGVGCPHCANMITLFTDLSQSYNFSMILKEIKYDPQNREELFAKYDAFGFDPAKGGIPTLLINDKLLIVGELGRIETVETIKLCDAGKCPVGAYASSDYSKLIKNISQNTSFNYSTNITLNTTTSENLTSTKNNGDVPLMILIPAAIADSINPCTMAIMAMLLAITLQKEGKKKVLISGIVFATVIFICYLLMGVGIMHFIGNSVIQKYFFYIMLAITSVITILEIKSFFFYKPGMESIEIPMMFRPMLHDVMEKATSLPMVALVAVFCSFVLLPCSSGPYLMVLSMLSLTDLWTAEFFKAMSYLILYNLIFILPLLAITAIVAFGIKNPMEILSLRDKYVKEMHLITGLIMLALTIGLLVFIFSGSYFN